MVNKEELQKMFDLMCSGDMRAFEYIYNNLSTPLFTIIVRIIKDEALSEDVLQDFFIKLFLSPPKSQVRNPRAYMFQMAHNLAIDNLRKKDDHVHLDSCIGAIINIPAGEQSAEMYIEEAMKILPGTECEIVSLKLNGGFTFREIANIMGIPIGTAIWKYQKAISRLQKILSGGVK